MQRLGCMMFSPFHVPAHLCRCRFTTHENLENNIFTVPEIKRVNARSDDSSISTNELDADDDVERSV
jgi:hypothetical protein